MKADFRINGYGKEGPPRHICTLQYAFDDPNELILFSVVVAAQEDQDATKAAALAKAKSFARKFYEGATID